MCYITARYKTEHFLMEQITKRVSVRKINEEGTGKLKAPRRNTSWKTEWQKESN